MCKSQTNLVVIGANYGDEGKGRCTRYALNKYLLFGIIEDKSEAIVIKHNGGSQAGHTSEGFVYHAYGSADVETYLAPEFIVNPKAILAEMKSLTIKRDKIPNTMYINNMCRVSTPIDILCNQVIESVRGNNKHGSCGMGIYATITRSKTISTTIRDLMNKDFRKEITNKLILYYKGYEDAIRFIPEQFQDLDLDRMMNDFYDEFDELVNDDGIQIITVDKEEELLKSKNLRIFETGQGLLLDEKCKESYPHVTPSRTNHVNPFEIIKRCNLLIPSNNKVSVSTIPVYCTRPYITKHGAGVLDDEIVDTSKIMLEKDTTNVKNEWQGSIRAAYMDLNKFGMRIVKDFKEFKQKCYNLSKKLQPNTEPTDDYFSPKSVNIFISFADHFNSFVTGSRSNNAIETFYYQLSKMEINYDTDIYFTVFNPSEIISHTVNDSSVI